MIIEILAAATLAALIALYVWRRSWRRAEDPQLMEAWLENFSPAAYQPMLRLSESSDTGFLATHRGPEEAARYRRLQRQMLKEYLRGLSRDFHRLHVLASQKKLHPPPANDSSPLAHVEEKLEFIFTMWSIELRLLLDEIAPNTINLRPLLANVNELTERAREGARRRHVYRI